jgi:hypothetical protein
MFPRINRLFRSERCQAGRSGRDTTTDKTGTCMGSHQRAGQPLRNQIHGTIHIRQHGAKPSSLLLSPHILQRSLCTYSKTLFRHQVFHKPSKTAPVPYSTALQTFQRLLTTPTRSQILFNLHKDCRNNPQSLTSSRT